MHHGQVSVNEDPLDLEARVRRAVELRREHPDGGLRTVRDGGIVLLVFIGNKEPEGFPYPFLGVEDLHEAFKRLAVAGHADQPLSPPEKPWMKRFCANRNNARMGIMDTMTIAKMEFHFETSEPMK